jgi:RNA polymerase-binding transcription factor DksA
MSGFDRARRELDEERSRLQRIKSSLSVEDDAARGGEVSIVDQHEADVGTEMFERQRDMSILQQVTESLDDVDRALRRLDEGSYGACEACGQPIGDDRLRARPETRFCLQDQARAERETGARP